jgi:hypothetical protein
MPRNIEDGTVSIYINGLKDGTRYRESGLVLRHTTRESPGSLSHVPELARSYEFFCLGFLSMYKGETKTD